MPTYVFSCVKCGREQEFTCSIKDLDATNPLCFDGECNGESMEVVIQATSFQLKGVGWARDGYSKVMGEKKK